MDDYSVVRTLGRGGFAVVKLVKRRSDDENFVIKQFLRPMDQLTQKEKTEVSREIKLLAHLRHPNIVKFVDSFIEDGIMHIVMEYAAKGTLHKLIVNRDGEYFSEDRIWEMFVQVSRKKHEILKFFMLFTGYRYFLQILLSLNYVHCCSVMHRDMKTQNIMLTGEDARVIKLGTFHETIAGNNVLYL